MTTLKPVNSSSISHVGHDPERNELTIQFKAGSRYVFAGVPAEEHDALVKAPSIGKHFMSRIRTRFTGKKV